MLSLQVMRASVCSRSQRPRPRWILYVIFLASVSGVTVEIRRFFILLITVRRCTTGTRNFSRMVSSELSTALVFTSGLILETRRTNDN